MLSQFRLKAKTHNNNIIIFEKKKQKVQKANYPFGMIKNSS